MISIIQGLEIGESLRLECIASGVHWALARPDINGGIKDWDNRLKTKWKA